MHLLLPAIDIPFFVNSFLICEILDIGNGFVVDREMVGNFVIRKECIVWGLELETTKTRV